MRIRWKSGYWLPACAAAVAFLAIQSTGTAQTESSVKDPAQVEAQERSEESRAAGESHSGAFAALEDGQFRMTIDGKNAHTHQVNEQTRVLINGQPAELKDLQKGDRIDVTTNRENFAVLIEVSRQDNATNENRSDQQEVALGVRLRESPTTGVLITDIRPQSPAATVGLRSGDYILTIDGTPINSVESFDAAMAEFQPGDQAKLTIWRNSQAEQLTVAFPAQRRTALRPEIGSETQNGWLGVLLDEAQGTETGVRIANVYPTGPASRAGIRSGDLLLEVAGEKVNAPDKAAELISAKKPNESVELVIHRNGEAQSVTATLADRRDFFQQEGAIAPPDGQSSQFGEFSDDETIPEHAMMLEQHRHFAEQHERIERKLDQVLEELNALRSQLGQTPDERAEGEVESP